MQRCSDNGVGTPDVSIVVPVRNERSTLRRLFESVRGVFEAEDKSFELIFIDDGSDDGSLGILRALARDDGRVRALWLRRSFGKAAALATGFRAARGAHIVTMDGDLQDEPAEIPRLLAKLEEGYGVVSGWKQHRRDPWTRRFASKVFNWATRVVCDVELHDVNCGLKAYTRECAREVADSCYGDLHRYLPVVAHWKGFSVAELPVAHRKRASGRSRYGLERYLRGFLDLLTTAFLSRYARRPMHVFGSVGLLSFATGSTILVWLSLEKIVLGEPLGQRPLLLFGAVFFVAGLQLLLCGLIAEMVSRVPVLVAKTHLRETSDYPAFAVAEAGDEAEALDAPITRDVNAAEVAVGAAAELPIESPVGG